jgi:hypothetical protein
MPRTFLSILSLCICTVVALAQKNELQDPPVLTSAHRVLNLLVVAREKPIRLAGLHPEAWVYEVCERPTTVKDACPAGSGTLSPYGGVRLQLMQGDHLRISPCESAPARARRR